MLRALGRIIGVVLSFVVAAVTAGAVLLTIGAERATRELVGTDPMSYSPDAVAGVLGAAASLMSAMTLIPAIGLVVVGEVARIRSALYYIVGGGAAMAAIPLMARLGGGGIPATMLWQLFATAGFAGGLVYWLLAGRRA